MANDSGKDQNGVERRSIIEYVKFCIILKIFETPGIIYSNLVNDATDKAQKELAKNDRATTVQAEKIKAEITTRPGVRATISVRKF